MSKEAIILAGGMGTRLQSVVSDVPKCMAPVDGKPFLAFIIDCLLQQGVHHFIFSVGYKKEVIEDYLKSHYGHINYTLVIEAAPLGTGGAIKLSCEKAKEEMVLVLNGDTMFDIDVQALYNFNNDKKADCILCLKPMQHFDRYGVVEINDQNRIASFKEKQFYASGLISGGVYLLNVPNFLKLSLPEKFSIEKDYLEKYYTTQRMFGFVQYKYFIDIGIPEDYSRAQQELKTFNHS